MVGVPAADGPAAGSPARVGPVTDSPPTVAPTCDGRESGAGTTGAADAVGPALSPATGSGTSMVTS